MKGRSDLRMALRALWVSLIVCGILAILPESCKAETFYDRNAPKVVIVVNTMMGVGGGGVIVSENQIVTCNHLLNNTNKVSVRFFDGTVAEASVVERDKREDIARLRVKKIPKSARVAILNVDLPQVADRVWAIYHPNALKWSYGEGYIMGVRHSSGVLSSTTIQVGIQVAHGSSGGGIFNEKGELVGILNAALGDEGSLSIAFAVPSVILCDKLFNCKEAK